MKKLLITLIVIGSLVLCLDVYIAIDLTKYNIKADETVDDSEVIDRITPDLHIYELNEIDESMIGKELHVIGFMCNETGEDTSAAWICEKPFKSKNDVSAELRIDTGNIIEYSPQAIVVKGTLMNDEYVDGDARSYKLGNAEIYLYDGPDKKYKRINQLVQNEVISSIVKFIDAVENDTVYNSDIETLEQKLTIVNSLGESKFVALIEYLLDYEDKDITEVVESGMKGLVDAIYEEETGEE